jgi:hypothetical protein
MKAGKVIHETPLGGNPRRPFFDPATELRKGIANDANEDEITTLDVIELCALKPCGYSEYLH